MQERVLTKLKKRSRGQDEDVEDDDGDDGGDDGEAPHEQEESKQHKRKHKHKHKPQIEEQVEILQADGHINFFAEAEKQQRELAKNKEYELEKEARELLEKRRSGVAPWALGEGAFEHKKMKVCQAFAARV